MPLSKQTFRKFIPVNGHFLEDIRQLNIKLSSICVLMMIEAKLLMSVGIKKVMEKARNVFKDKAGRSR